MIDIKKINNLLKPLMKYRKYIEGIYIYGSVLQKKKANDIDILIILVDYPIIGDKIIKSIENNIKEIEKNAEKDNINLHFQPLKPLDLWWNLLIQGEPWVVTSLKKILILYDKHGLIKEVHNFIKDGMLYLREEKADKLLERSDNLILKNRDLLLESIVHLSNAATEAAQILLLFEGKLVINKRKIARDLMKYSKTLSVGNYIEIIDLEEKFVKGVLSEFTGENLDYYSDAIKNFINKIEALIHKKYKEK
ncbi:MAG: hypothetical protein QXD48_00765 [Candidatus Aenigmatarchaeota archaeon]